MNINATEPTSGLNWNIRRLVRNPSEMLNHPVGMALFLLIMLLVLLLGLLVFLGPEFTNGKDIGQGVFVEATGAMMDLVVFGLFIAAVAAQRERNREIRSHEDLIEDLKKWDSEEARHRIGGAIRRLNNLRRTAIKFAGLKLSDFWFSDHGINSIAESTFYDGTFASWGPGKVELTRVYFSSIDCCKVVFSTHDFLSTDHAIFRDCSFVHCKLTGATFSGALLEWTEEPPEETGYWVEDDDGSGGFYQEHYPPFYEVDLAGVSFEKAVFRNADFRHAYNLELCNFSGAKGLEDCVFDSENIREKVLKSVADLAED